VKGSLVANFQKDVLDPDKSVTNVLRMAKVISAKLGLNDIEEWIGAELNGYPDDKSPPDYRHAGGTLEALDPYRGWKIVQQERVDFSPKTNYPLEGAYSSAMQRGVFSGIVFNGMVEAVRDRLLDWSLELEKRGITGDDMSFDEREKDAAHNPIFNIQTAIFGNVSQTNVNLYDYSSIYQQLEQWNVPHSQRSELKNILEKLKSSPPEKKPSLIEKGKAWIVRNQAFLGAGLNIIRQVLGIPDVSLRSGLDRRFWQSGITDP
jgi:hypothetical protein